MECAKQYLKLHVTAAFSYIEVNCQLQNQAKFTISNVFWLNKPVGKYSDPSQNLVGKGLEARHYSITKSGSLLNLASKS